MERTAGEYVGGARLVGSCSFGGGQANHRLADFVFNNFEDIARGAQIRVSFFIDHGGDKEK